MLDAKQSDDLAKDTGKEEVYTLADVKMQSRENIVVNPSEESGFSIRYGNENYLLCGLSLDLNKTGLPQRISGKYSTEAKEALN